MLTNVMKIPRIIHYCWFGGKEKPEIVKKCIDSWKKNLSQYELIEWNEKNFDINNNPYVQEAYK
ncbi:capsular polysaccharide synthesis protein, partial [Bacillus mobilis]|uniref:capsular polysaccharide synthesis protein n=2 Tax=Bacillus TaxID=1386 RepID=UPI0035D9288E